MHDFTGALVFLISLELLVEVSVHNPYSKLDIFQLCFVFVAINL